MKLEEVIPLVGNFGRYQLFVALYTGLLCMVGCMITFGDMFFAAETDHWCQVLPAENCSIWVEFQANCTDVKKSILLPPPENENSKYPHSNCKQWDLPPGYEFDPYESLSQDANFTNDTVLCEDGWGFDTSQYKTTIISDFDLVCDKRNLPSLAQSMYFLGFLVGSFVCGSLSDWIGRKKVVFFGLFFLAAGSIVTAFSVNIYMYIAARFFAGFGNMGFYIPVFVLVVEFTGGSWRTAVTMAVSILYAFGYFFLATAAMYVREWRTLCLIISLPTLPFFIPPLFMQESLDWLVSKGRTREAEDVVRRVAKINKKTLPEVVFNDEDIQEETKESKSTIPPSVIDLFKTPNMAFKTINIMFNWTVNNLVYYGLAQSTGDLGVDEYWAFFVSGAVDIPSLIYATFGVEWFGRKWNLVVLELVAGIGCIATVFIPLGIWRTVVAMIAKFGVAASYGILYLYTSELFPTPVRSIGLGMGGVAAQLGGILSPIILLLGKYVESLPQTLFGSSAALGAILLLLMPETKGRPLPQTLKEGEEIGKCWWMCRKSDEGPISSDLDNRLCAESSLSNPAFDSKEADDLNEN